MGAVQTAIVTGASRGLGAAIATELAATGVQVAVNYFYRRDAAERVCQNIREAGGSAEPFLPMCGAKMMSSNWLRR